MSKAEFILIGTKKIVYFIFAGFFLLMSCTKDEPGKCIKTTGPLLSEKRDLTGFSRIFIENNVNVFLKEGLIFDVKVEAGKNLIPFIVTEVKNNELRIANRNRCNFLRTYQKPVNVYIILPEVSYIKNFGSGKVESTDTLHSSLIEYETKGPGDFELTVSNTAVVGHMHGSGDATLHGKTGSHACHNVGNGFVKAEDLKTDYTWVWSNTTGEMYVDVKDQLEIFMCNHGNIYYKGNPAKISKTITGQGNLLKQQ